MVEFALVLPLLVLLLVMAVDFGRVFFGWVSINNAARVGASYAAANADAWEGGGDAVRQARFIALVQNDLQGVNCAVATIDDPSITDVDGDGAYETGDPVEVAIDCDFSLLTPLASSIVGTVELGGTSTFPVNYTITSDLPSPPPPPPPPTCTVPNTVSLSRDQARDEWEEASFQPSNLIENGTDNFTVATQSVPPGSELPCASGSMTISEASGPPPPTCTRPTANFMATPTSGATPLQVSFTDLSTTPAGCPILSWQWNFHNGNSSTERDPIETFVNTSPGKNDVKFTISLTVTNAAGSDTVTKNNLIVVSKP